MSGLFIFLVMPLTVVYMVLAMSEFSQHPFTVLTVVVIVMGLVRGIPTEKAINTVKSGFGDILASIGIVILAGTVIETIPGKTGAALTVANTIPKMVEKKNSVLTTAITGYVTGVLAFHDSGFAILNPIPRALTSQSNVSLAVIATVLPGGLCVTRCLVPPTPGPIAMAGTLETDLGLTMLVRLLVSASVTLSTFICVKKISSKIGIPANPRYTVDELLQKYGKLPGVLCSFPPILPSIVLTAFKSVGDFPSASFGGRIVEIFFSFIGNPVTALILGVSLAMTLVLVTEKKNALSWTIKGITNSAGILAVTGADGALGAIPQKFPIASALSASFLGLDVDVFLPFITAALLKITVGASAVAMTIASAMIVPLMPALGFTSPLAKVFVIMVIGTGSMTVSHANDSYFRVVSQFPDMETKDAYKCQTGVTGVTGIMTIIAVFLLSLVFVH